MGADHLRITQDVDILRSGEYGWKAHMRGGPLKPRKFIYFPLLCPTSGLSARCCLAEPRARIDRPGTVSRISTGDVVLQLSVLTHSF